MPEALSKHEPRCTRRLSGWSATAPTHSAATAWRRPGLCAMGGGAQECQQRGAHNVDSSVPVSTKISASFEGNRRLGAMKGIQRRSESCQVWRAQRAQMAHILRALVSTMSEAPPRQLFCVHWSLFRASDLHQSSTVRAQVAQRKRSSSLVHRVEGRLLEELIYAPFDLHVGKEVVAQLAASPTRPGPAFMGRERLGLRNERGAVAKSGEHTLSSTFGA
jgi:hypothetical protein